MTHGYTLTDNIPFRDACRAIAEAIQNDDDWPVFVSLECHVGVDGQEELVTIMREEWGARLVDSEVEGVEVDKVTPGHLRGRIVLMVSGIRTCPTRSVLTIGRWNTIPHYLFREKCQVPPLRPHHRAQMTKMRKAKKNQNPKFLMTCIHWVSMHVA